MKLNKKLALAAFGAVLSATALVNINNVQSVELTDLQKENLEALAKQVPTIGPLCESNRVSECDYSVVYPGETFRTAGRFR